MSVTKMRSNMADIELKMSEMKMKSEKMYHEMKERMNSFDQKRSDRIDNSSLTPQPESQPTISFRTFSTT